MNIRIYIDTYIYTYNIYVYMYIYVYIHGPHWARLFWGIGLQASWRVEEADLLGPAVLALLQPAQWVTPKDARATGG